MTQVQVVNSKTKTALANLLSNRLQGNSEGSASGQTITSTTTTAGGMCPPPAPLSASGLQPSSSVQLTSSTAPQHIIQGLGGSHGHGSSAPVSIATAVAAATATAGASGVGGTIVVSSTIHSSPTPSLSCSSQPPPSSPSSQIVVPQSPVQSSQSNNIIVQRRTLSNLTNSSKTIQVSNVGVVNRAHPSPQTSPALPLSPVRTQFYGHDPATASKCECSVKNL